MLIVSSRQSLPFNSYFLLHYRLQIGPRLLLLRRSRRSWVDNSFIGQWVGVNCDSGDFWRLQWRRFLAPRLRPFAPNWKPFPLVQCIPSIQNLAKNRVHVIQVRLLLVQDEKLRLKRENQVVVSKNGFICHEWQHYELKAPKALLITLVR